MRLPLQLSYPFSVIRFQPIVYLLLILFGYSFLALPVYAKGGVQVSPAFVEVDIQNAGEKKISVQITNKTERDDFRCLSLDFRQKR
jgi:hypothetical protein